MDFIEIVNIIFTNKKAYWNISDEDKISAFFKINRKFGKQYPDISSQFNHKNVDKASAIDMWFLHFKNEYKIPQWYWDPKERTTIKAIKKGNYDYIKQREELKDIEIQYLEKHFENDLKDEMKKLNKFEL